MAKSTRARKETESQKPDISGKMSGGAALSEVRRGKLPEHTLISLEYIKLTSRNGNAMELHVTNTAKKLPFTWLTLSLDDVLSKGQVSRTDYRLASPGSTFRSRYECDPACKGIAFAMRGSIPTNTKPPGPDFEPDYNFVGLGKYAHLMEVNTGEKNATLKT